MKQRPIDAFGHAILSTLLAVACVCLGHALGITERSLLFPVVYVFPPIFAVGLLARLVQVLLEIPDAPR